MKDLDCIKQTLRDLNLQFKRVTIDQDNSVESSKIALVIKTGQQYNLNLVINEDGTYNLVGQLVGLNLTQEQFLKKLTQRYAYNKVVKEVEKKGFKIAKEIINADRSIKLVVRRWN